MTKIGIFGSAFDPPTLGHKLLLEAACDLRGYDPTQPDLPEFDEVWIVPCYGHIFGKQPETADHRVKLCEILFSALPKKAKIKTYEIEWQHSGSTYAALQRLQQGFPEHEFSVLIGGDNLYHIEQWVNWQKLIREFEFVAFMRLGYDGDIPHQEEYKKLWILPLLIKHFGVSSTQVRKLLSSNNPYRGPITEDTARAIVGQTCYDYIVQHGLYLGEEYDATNY